MKNSLQYNLVILKRLIFKRINFLIRGKHEFPIKKIGKKKVIIIHINKTGGTSIGYALGIKEKQHLTALDIRNIIGVKLWDEAFKIAFVRNPWDRIVSLYRYRQKNEMQGFKEKTIPFDKWVKSVFVDKNPDYYDIPQMFFPQVDWLKDEFGNINIDFIGKFENIEADFKRVCSELGINKKLPHLNKTIGDNYRRYYNEETKKIISEWFAKDIEYFDYEF